MDWLIIIFNAVILFVGAQATRKYIEDAFLAYWIGAMIVLLLFVLGGIFR